MRSRDLRGPGVPAVNAGPRSSGDGSSHRSGLRQRSRLARTPQQRLIEPGDRIAGAGDAATCRGTQQSSEAGAATTSVIRTSLDAFRRTHLTVHCRRLSWLAVGGHCELLCRFDRPGESFSPTCANNHNLSDHAPASPLAARPIRAPANRRYVDCFWAGLWPTTSATRTAPGRSPATSRARRVPTGPRWSAMPLTADVSTTSRVAAAAAR